MKDLATNHTTAVAQAKKLCDLIVKQKTITLSSHIYTGHFLERARNTDVNVKKLR